MESVKPVFLFDFCFNLKHTLGTEQWASESKNAMGLFGWDEIAKSGEEKFIKWNNEKFFWLKETKKVVKKKLKNKDLSLCCSSSSVVRVLNAEEIKPNIVKEKLRIDLRKFSRRSNKKIQDKPLKFSFNDWTFFSIKTTKFNTLLILHKWSLLKPFCKSSKIPRALPKIPQ